MNSVGVMALVTAFLIGMGGVAAGRAVRIWTYQELLEKSDLVVMAIPAATNDTDEHIDFLGFAGQRVVGVETRFAVSCVVKGDKAPKDVVLHHYRVPDGPNVAKVPNGPIFVSSDAARKQRFLLFLVREADGRYAPTAGQTDPGASVKEAGMPLRLSAGDLTTYSQLTNRISTLAITISLGPFDSNARDSGGGLRSVLLHVRPTLRVEPAARWPDGSLASASARIQSDQALRILQALSGLGVLTNASKYYSERIPNPKSLPPAADHITTHLAQDWAARSAEIRLSVFDDEFYSDYIVSIPWGARLTSVLVETLGILADSPAEPMLCDLIRTSVRSPIAISIAVPVRNGERKLEYRDRAAHFHVIVSNESDKPQRIWRESCSWGYDGLFFEFTDDSGKKSIAKKKPRIWTVNAPDWWTIEPGECLVIDVYFGDAETWSGFPLPENGSQSVRMQAVLEFDSDDQARQHDIWTGRVTSNVDQFAFYKWN